MTRQTTHRFRGRIEICQWCCARCRSSSQRQFTLRLLAVGVQPRDAQCWRCVQRLEHRLDLRKAIQQSQKGGRERRTSDLT